MADHSAVLIFRTTGFFCNPPLLEERQIHYKQKNVQDRLIKILAEIWNPKNVTIGEKEISIEKYS